MSPFPPHGSHHILQNLNQHLFPKFQPELAVCSLLPEASLLHSPASKPSHRQATALALIITCSNVCCFSSRVSHWVQSSLSVLLVTSGISAPNPGVTLSAAFQHTKADAFCLAALQKLVEEGSAVINPFGSQLCCSFSVWGFVLCLSCQSLGFVHLEPCQL